MDYKTEKQAFFLSFELLLLAKSLQPTFGAVHMVDA